jgi:hypothetical protein
MTKNSRPQEGQQEPTESPPGRHAPGFPIVGIGASAGGLEALDELLENMPPNTGMAFVVVTHQPPDHTSLLPELLGRETSMPVSLAEDGMELAPDHVYIAPPGCQLAILNGTLHRMDADKLAAPKFPIDYFFHSLADDKKERAICGDFDIRELCDLVEETLPGTRSYADFKLDHQFSEAGHKILLINARSPGRESAGSGMVLLAIEDVTGNFRKDSDR